LFIFFTVGIMYRNSSLNHIRKKQGYDITAYLKKAASKGKRVDIVKLGDIMSGLGFILCDTALDVIFLTYGTGKKSDTLDLIEFASALEKADEMDDNNGNEGYRRSEYNGNDHHETGDGKCDIQERILKEYDATVVRALEYAFDMFDTKVCIMEPYIVICCDIICNVICDVISP
jgi:hypothetical protein